jgi:hypothetical protein
MMQWKSTGYGGLDRDECPEVWSRIMRTVEDGHGQVQIQLGEGENWPEFKEAAKMYSRLVVDHLEETLGLPLDAYTSPVPPWS